MATGSGKWRDIGHLPLAGSNVSLALRIKSVRLFSGLSQVVFARVLGVSRSYLSEVEAEKAKPSIEMIVGIASHFPDVDSGWLLSGKGQMIVDTEPGAMVVAVRKKVVAELGAKPRSSGPKRKPRRRRKRL